MIPPFITHPVCRQWACALLLAAGLLQGEGARAENPFSLEVDFRPLETPPTLSLRWTIPPDHYLYADEIRVDATPPVILKRRSGTEPIRRFDENLQKDLAVYTRSADLRFVVEGWASDHPFEVSVVYQGCRDDVCFLPQEEHWRIGPGDQVERLGGATSESVGKAPANPPWREARRVEGYHEADVFLRFLEGKPLPGDTFWKRALAAGGWMTLLVSLLGGLLLNLTPCVLPLVPVILAILGAGNRAHTRLIGFTRGLFYGAGMAVAYGMLGVVVVRTGAFFGAWAASPLFNAVLAVLFAVLALSLFGVFTLDFSRFQPRVARSGGGATVSGWEWATVFSMGAVSAVLAGACVAPVVVAVLAHSAAVYTSQRALALLLPLALGVGMALPWPLAGAGLTILPRPGRWMTVVKFLFGVAVLLIAIPYARTAFEGFRSGRGTSGLEQEAVLQSGLERAAWENRPVLLDFWATWCKSCIAMEKTTFQDPRVRQAIARFSVIKVQAERPSDPAIREILRRYAVTGLPTFVILERTETDAAP